MQSIYYNNMNTTMKSKRKKSKKKIENNIEKATQSASILNNKKSNFSEFLFWFIQIIVVIFEYAFVITLFVLMIKTLFTDDYNDPYFMQQIPGGFDKWYGVQLLALKFIIWVKDLFI